MATLQQLEKEFNEWSGFSLEGETRQDKEDYINSTYWTLECELSKQRDILIKRLSEVMPNSKCPECLMEVDQEELDMFGGLCEECANQD